VIEGIETLSDVAHNAQAGVIVLTAAEPKLLRACSGSLAMVFATTRIQGSTVAKIQ